MPRRKKVTLRMIADRLGVTVHTVSKALRGLPGMSESTRREISEAARELGYRTKAQAAGLSAEQIPWPGAGKPRRFALLMTGEAPFHHLQVEGLHQRLHELGHVLTTVVLPKPLQTESGLLEWMERSGLLFLDGLFLPPGLPEWMELALVRLPLPAVMINYPPDGSLADSVIWDVQHAVHLSLNQMYEEGHRRILFVGDTRTQRGFRLRWQAFLDACQRLGLPMSPDEHVTGPPGTGTDWLNSLTAKLADGGYTAVLCALNRDVTWAAVALERAGLTVPGHVSLIGTDHEAHPAYPGLTRPVLLVREAAERAAELMLRRIGSPLLPFEHVRLRGGAFFRGETLGPPPRESREQAGGREG